MRSRISLGVPLAAVALVALARPAFGGGFELRGLDAKQIGLAHAFTAVADTPAAIAQNPAGMSQLDGFQGSFGAHYVDNRTHFEAFDAVEGEENSRYDPAVIPQAFGTFEVNDVVTVGLGTFSPYGLNVLWRDDWPGRYIAYYFHVETIEFLPSVSAKIPLGEGATLALGGGAGLVRTALEAKQAIDFSAFGAPDGFVKLYGNNTERLNFTWDVGALLSMFDRKVRLGIAYYAAIDGVRVHGRAEFWNQPTNPLTGAPAVPQATKASVQLVHPERLRIGLAVTPVEMLTVSGEFAWNNWSRLTSVIIDFPDLGRQQPLAFYFRDSYFLSLGFDVKATDYLSARMGFMWDQSPTKNRTVNPALPDNDRYGVSFGAGVSPVPQLTIDATYQFVWLQQLTKNNDIGADLVSGGSPRANGDYDTFAHVVALTFGVKF